MGKQISGDPLISVLIATYNQAPFIGRAVEGALNQKTRFKFEIIIGEDCSTDGTREIVQEYQERNPRLIKVVTSRDNIGPRENYRRIRKAASGKYLAYCDGDDYWQNDSKIEKQATYLEEHADCGLVYSSYDIFHPKDKIVISDFIRHRKWNLPEKPEITDFLEGKVELIVGILTCTVMVRGKLIEEIIESDPYLYNSQRFLMGDTQLWAEVSSKGYLHFIPESTATHVITEESLTRSEDKIKPLMFNISRAKLFIYLCKKYNMPSRIRQMHEKELDTYELELAFKLKDHDLAKKVKNRKNQFTIKEKMQYLGSKYWLINKVYSSGKTIADNLGNNGNPWY
jgi:glycosyltransferase involved in cell wall biosynthesis